MKDISDTLKIVTKKEADSLDRTHNVSVFSKLTDDKYLVKFSGKLSQSILFLISNSLESKKKDNLYEYSKEQLRKSGLNKTVSVTSAVHIAAAITSYARMITNEYKNIPGNLCIMSDTDSVVLTKPLPKYLVGRELGQMKLEQIIKEGIFIRKKLYCLINSNNQEIIRSSGMNPSHLNYNLFKKLLNGESITIERKTFNVGWKDLIIDVVNSEITVHGLTQNIKTIYNTKDVNFKFISFPIKYSIIIHPLYPMEPIIVPYLKTKILDNSEIIKPSIGYSYFELITLFIFLFSYFIIFGYFLYKIY